MTSNSILKRRSVRWILVAVALVAVVAVVVYVVAARASGRDEMVEFVVNTDSDNLADMGELSCSGREGQLCPLREAIEKANEDEKPNRISFDLTEDEKRIELESSALTIEDDAEDLDLIIEGTGDLQIVGEGLGAVFDIAGTDSTYLDEPDQKPTVEISGVTISGGKSLTGAGITNDFGTLTLKNVTIRDNAAESAGGGLHNYGGIVEMQDSEVSSNTAKNGGAGIVNQDGQMTLRNTTVSGNESRLSGAGIFNDPSSVLSVYGGRINDNEATAEGSSGAGVYNAGELRLGEVEVTENAAGYGGGGLSNPGYATVTASSISGNSASLGGGIETSGILTVESSTIDDNTAGRGSGLYNNSAVGENSGTGIFTSTVFGNSGSSGLFNAKGGLNVTGSTVSGNEGGVQTSADPFTKTTFASSIVAGNDGDDIELVFGEADSIDSDGDNLTGTGIPLDGRNDRSGLTAEAALGAEPELSDNGGPTRTVALASGSPAIDAITRQKDCQNPGTAFATDQRGAEYTRTEGEFRCDIGAFEYGTRPAELSVSLDGPAEGTLDGGLTYTLDMENAPGAGPTTEAALTLESDANITATASDYPPECGLFCRMREFFSDGGSQPILSPTVPAVADCNIVIDVSCYAGLGPGESYEVEITLTPVEGSPTGTFTLRATASAPNSYGDDETRRLRVDLTEP